MSDKESIPKDKINLHLLLVDGKSHDFLFEPSVTASQIASHVFHNWPSDWDGEALQKPETPEVLKFIFRGAFVNRSAKLSSFSLPLGKTTTMHLTIRESQQNEQTTVSSSAHMKVVSSEGSRCCIVL